MCGHAASQAAEAEVGTDGHVALTGSLDLDAADIWDWMILCWPRRVARGPSRAARDVYVHARCLHTWSALLLPRCGAQTGSRTLPNVPEWRDHPRLSTAVPHTGGPGWIGTSCHVYTV